MKKENVKIILKYVLMLLSILAIFGLLKIIFIILTLFGIMREYQYVKIDDSNKEKMILLLKGQQYNMFNKSKDLDAATCIESVSKIEMEFLFPDGEIYYIYCNGNSYYFSLDNTDFDLPNYISNNGKKGYKLRSK